MCKVSVRYLAGTVSSKQCQKMYLAITRTVFKTTLASHVYQYILFPVFTMWIPSIYNINIKLCVNFLQNST